MDLVAAVSTPVLACLAIAALVAADALAPIVPGEVAVISGGALAAAGHLHPASVVAAAALGAIVGDLAVFSISRRTLPTALERSAVGRRLHARVRRAHTTLGSAGAAAIIAARFVPFGRTTAAAAAGLTELRARRFAVLALVGGTVWAAWISGLGFVTERVADAPLWLSVLLGTAIGIAVGIWVKAGYVVVRTYRRLSGRAARPADTGTAQSATPELVG